MGSKSDSGELKGRIASVLMPLPLPEAFDYAEPEGMALREGDMVAVPLGPRMIRGVVSALRDSSGGNRPLKPVAARLDEPSLPPGTLAFVLWAARYAVEVPGAPLAIALRGLGGVRAKPERRLVATASTTVRETAARRRVLQAATEPVGRAALARAAGVSDSVIKVLLDHGALVKVEIDRGIAFARPDPCRPGAQLNRGQAAAAAELTSMVGEHRFRNRSP